MTRTNLLLVSRRFPPSPGGVEFQVMQQASWLARRGHKVEVHTSDLYSDIPFRRLPPQDTASYDFQVCRHMAIPVPWRKAEGTSFAPNIFPAVRKIGTSNIVHCHGLNLFTVSTSLYLRRIYKCKAVCSTHVDPTLLAGRFVRRILAKFDGIAALTEIEQRRLLSLGFSRSKVQVVPNGIDVDAFRHLPSRDGYKVRNGIVNHLIVYAGRIDSFTKGCDLLVEAVSLAQRRVGPCTLVFAGPDWGATGDLGKLSRLRGVEAIFPGNLDPVELRSLLVACDVFVLPSRREAFGLSILTAMLCLAPVVATHVGGIPAVVRDGDTGLLVPPGNSQSLAEAICRILENPDFAKRIAGNARSSVGEYAIDRTMDRLEDFYNAVLVGG